MEQRIIENSNIRYIFEIKEKNITFYMTIPKTQKINITLNIENTINSETIKNITIQNNEVLITPILYNEFLQSLKSNNAQAYYELDNIFSLCINTAYQILTFNHIEVENKIKIKEKKEYIMFIAWFSKKYQERIVVVKEEQKILTPPVTNKIEQPPIENKEIPKNNQILNKEAVAIDKSDEELVNNGFAESNQLKEENFGFVSYVLLGVIVAVLSLVFLYFIV